MSTARTRRTRTTFSTFAPDGLGQTKENPRAASRARGFLLSAAPRFNTWITVSSASP
ncbi:hypothetical protein RHECNPAF_1760091 [Rhizobium etli CNPAF512]|nr:hypothetical protein RHECNPAF_1760091 [Rhizobium etli CNPAF512]